MCDRCGVTWQALSLGALLFLGGSAQAEDDIWSTAQVHAFGSQSWLKSNRNDFFGPTSSSGGSWDFTELGINGSIRPLNNLQLSGQIIGRRAGESDRGSVDVDYLFADLNIRASDTGLFGTRVGRVKNPLGFYNETRDVAFTRPSIWLPQSIYPDGSRELALSSDGVQIYGETRNDVGTLSFQMNYGYPRVDDDELEIEIQGRDAPGSMDSKRSFLFRAMYDHVGGRWRAGVTYGDVHATYNAKSSDTLPSVGDFRFRPLIFSGQYNAERWSVVGEFAFRKPKLGHFRVGSIDPGLPDVEYTGISYYLQGSYRFTPRLEGLIRYDVLYHDRNNKTRGCFFERGLGLPSHACFAKDWTMGLTWNVTPQIMLRAEYHFINGTGWLTRKDNPNPSETEKNWNLFAVQAAFRF